MILKDLKESVSNLPEKTEFDYGLTKPFSWRGSYDEVAFSILESPMTREEILANIELAYTETFHGYKGGKYQYNDYTNVNFEEEGSCNYSDGDYTEQMISRIEDTKEYKDRETKLINLIFTK